MISAIRANVTTAGKFAGIVGHIIAHNIRRGATYDVANAKQATIGIATPAVARSLGHASKADEGVTDAYVVFSYVRCRLPKRKIR